MTRNAKKPQLQPQTVEDDHDDPAPPPIPDLDDREPSMDEIPPAPPTSRVPQQPPAPANAQASGREMTLVELNRQQEEYNRRMFDASVRTFATPEDRAKFIIESAELQAAQILSAARSEAQRIIHNLTAQVRLNAAAAANK